MKNTVLLSAVLLMLIFSCSKDEKKEDVTQDILYQIAASGVWKITLFAEDEVIETPDFSAYTFKFLSTNEVLATSSIDTCSGTWGISKISDDSNPTGLQLDIMFATPEKFVSLTEDWDVMSAESMKIELRHVSGGDGSIDFLTFVNFQ